MPWAELLKVLGPTAISSLFNYGANKDASKAQARAMNEQIKLAKAMFDLQKKQSEMDLPYRRNLFNALQARVNRPTPRFLQRSFTPTNPYANMRRVMPTAYSASTPTGYKFRTPNLQNAFASMQSRRTAAPTAMANPAISQITE